VPPGETDQARVPFEGLVHVASARGRGGDAARCMAFDCLYLEGRDLLDMPLREASFIWQEP
jgi:ATP-dependent DNA ligase